MDIEIKGPIRIVLDTLELDEHIPSMKFDITFSVENFFYRLEVNSQIWVECQCFDEFVNGIKIGGMAILRDMDGLFELILDPIQGCLDWSCAKEDLDGYITSAKGREKLTDGLKCGLYEAFSNYPKWW